MGQKKRKPGRTGNQTVGSPKNAEPPTFETTVNEGSSKSNAALELETSTLSKFLQADSAAVQERVERIQELLGSETELTLAQRADLVYNRRPEILDLVSDLQQAYLILARRYDHVAGKVVRLVKSADSPVLDAPILQPLSATKRRPAKGSNGNSKRGGDDRAASASPSPSERTTSPSPEGSNLNPDAVPFVAVPQSPQLNPAAPPFTPSHPILTPSTPNGISAPAPNQNTLLGKLRLAGADAEGDPETPRMSTFRFKDVKASGGYNVEEEGPLHAGHLYGDLLGEGPVHAGHATGSWVPESVLNTEDPLQGPDIQEVVSSAVKGASTEAELDSEGEPLRDSQPLSAFLCAAQIQEAAGRKQGLSDAPRELSLSAGLEEGPVHAGHALMIRGASTKFERELRLTAQMAEALARDQMQARKFSDLDSEFVLQVKKDGQPARPVVKQSLLEEMICQDRGASEEDKKQLEGIGDPVQESGQHSDASDVEAEPLRASVLEAERLRGEVSDLVAQKREAIRYLTECVDVIRDEKKDVAAAAARLAAENFALREQLEEVLEARGGGLRGFGDDRQGWGEVIAEALEYGDVDLSGLAESLRAHAASPSTSNGNGEGRKAKGIVIREPEAGSKKGIESGESSVADVAGDRKGKGKVEEEAPLDKGRNGGGGKSALQELREENESLRRALAAVGEKQSRR
ncbi:hypothetical protein KFL_000500510 [Klebsormidium nitens]|uniref:NAB domain-containing protein n=1 Tax=Klebsormidium nitens TaxID=105231 RepID=A0A1Y1HUT2_KLENI|nr:hypothetical protein KFL_000500510 [Klebsormidium nitens]|eukprot:GAQ80297.1 hypothetical protein KFL_000500510 [Klebsormidium nitens]